MSLNNKTKKAVERDLLMKTDEDLDSLLKNLINRKAAIKAYPNIANDIWGWVLSNIVEYGKYTHDPNLAVFKEGVRQSFFLVAKYFDKGEIEDVLKILDDERKRRADEKKTNR